MTTSELRITAGLLDDPDFADVVREVMIAEGLVYSRALIVAAAWWDDITAVRPADRTPAPVEEVTYGA